VGNVSICEIEGKIIIGSLEERFRLEKENE
jgi:hypothetical protein